jgi:hypothetical protein
MFSTVLLPETTQSTPTTDMPGSSKEEIFQALIKETLALVLSELLAPQPTDLEIHANEHVIKELTKNPTIKNKEVGSSVLVAKRMKRKERKALAQVLTWELDKLLENQILYKPDDITGVPFKENTGSQATVSCPEDSKGKLVVEQRSQKSQQLTVGEACRRLGLRRDPVNRQGPGEQGWGDSTTIYYPQGLVDSLP